MGQQPNISKTFDQLPRPTPEPSAPRPWSPGRPGELYSPEDIPWGGMFGTPGPDAGFVYRLLAERELALGSERRADAEAALAGVAAARASHFGRAPTVEDVEVAELIFGYAAAGLPKDLIDWLAGQRPQWFTGLAHRPGSEAELAGAVEIGTLEQSPAEIRRRMSEGERLINR